ncbi:MAG: ABC transporter ATP-binding protein [Burkholderiaceae bacterium]
MTAALEVTGLNKHFGALHVSRDVSLVLQAGARHALIGPNGAGKTTLVNLITGALPADSGRVTLGGKDVTKLSQAQRARQGLGRTYQINQLFRELSVLENVSLSIAERRGLAGRMFRPMGHYSAVLDEAMALLVQFRLQEDAGTPIKQLAYGRQRLVEMVIAMGQMPSVLLLDEPAAGVASAESELILDAVDQLNKSVAVLIIEHDMDVVFRFANRITVLVAGGILTEGTPDEIAANDQVRSVYLGQGLK